MRLWLLHVLVHRQLPWHWTEVLTPTPSQSLGREVVRVGTGDGCLDYAPRQCAKSQRRWDYWGLHMISLLNRSGRQVFDPLTRKLRSLGVDSDAELNAVLNRIKVRGGARRGEDIIASGKSPRYSTLLIEGVACLYDRLPDGNRQIYAFQHAGDFCDLHQHVLPETNNEVAVAAMTDCSIGIIEQGPRAADSATSLVGPGLVARHHA
jgi:cyclic nucleotide-binding protein